MARGQSKAYRRDKEYLMALIETKSLTKTYLSGKNIVSQALNGIDLTIDQKEFVAIAGPSGSGKSSLLHLLGALDTPTEGRIIFDGKDITQTPLSQLSCFRLRFIGFVFQSYNLLPTLTALENVEYIMLLQGLTRADRQARAKKILDRVGLDDFLHRFPTEMSGGQQQRVAVARAIASEPKVVIADEPTANLDSKTASSLMELMRELNEEKGITFVFSTHDKIIMEKAKRLITLKDGKIVL
jgi:putative ABC transport system ATP-binding protein